MSVAIHPSAETDRLSRRFADMFGAFDGGDDVFAADVLFDLNMPVWRFQMRGREAWGAQMAALTRGPLRIDVLRTVPTASGFVAEHEEAPAGRGRRPHGAPPLAV